MITTEQMQEAIQGLTFVLLADTEPREWTRDDLVNAGLIYSHIALCFALKHNCGMGRGERTWRFAPKLREITTDYTGIDPRESVQWPEVVE